MGDAGQSCADARPGRPQAATSTIVPNERQRCAAKPWAIRRGRADYNPQMSDTASPRRRFSLDEANALLPTVREVTDEAVRACEQVVQRMEGLSADDAEHDR